MKTSWFLVLLKCDSGRRDLVTQTLNEILIKLGQRQVHLDIYFESDLGEDLKVVWAEFSTLSQVVLLGTAAWLEHGIHTASSRAENSAQAVHSQMLALATLPAIKINHLKIKSHYTIFFWLCGFWIWTVSIDLDRSRTQRV